MSTSSFPHPPHQPDDEGRAELDAWRERIAAARLPEPALAAVEAQLIELALLRKSSAEAARVRARLQFTLDLPWASPELSAEPAPSAVTAALELSHTGLASVKERIAELLAVRRLRGEVVGGALCFEGPPGTGKSSVARSIARALGRPFVWIPIGAMTLESELVGAPRELDGGPGAILDALRRAGRAGRADAVILLDELDKLELGGSGDSSGALLSIFDPELRREFFDRYLGVAFDLSRCLFIATAHDTEELAPKLLDRLDTLMFSGYTESEKVQITARHLAPKARATAGVNQRQLSLTPAALSSLIRDYTEEAGVRHLERLLRRLARKAAVRAVRDAAPLRVRKQDLLGLLGPSRVDGDLRGRRPAVGVVLGLAWTDAGGALLPIEALATQGTGRTTFTGQVGDVMRESFQTAASYLRTRLAALGLPRDAPEQIDLHLHCPSGAIPKDGPSAGLAIAIALHSLYSKRRVRHDVAMTGEISLYGHVLPIGGLREKVLAARRAGLTEIILPAGNEQEFTRLEPEIRTGLTVHLVAHVEDALEVAFAPRSSEGRRRRPAAAPPLQLPAAAKPTRPKRNKRRSDPDDVA